MKNEKSYKEEIYAKAEKVKTKKDLSKLLDEITEFGHDYGTVIYGCMAAMKGAFNFVNRSPNGGITGFQAGFLGWECVKEFMSVKGAAKILQYDDLLFPQYKSKFDKVISADIWKDIQKKATANLKKEAKNAHPSVIAHWKKIADGKLPFGFKVSEN